MIDRVLLNATLMDDLQTFSTKKRWSVTWEYNY